jgi:hypothetical protein
MTAEVLLARVAQGSGMQLANVTARLVANFRPLSV